MAYAAYSEFLGASSAPQTATHHRPEFVVMGITVPITRLGMGAPMESEVLRILCALAVFCAAARHCLVHCLTQR